VIAEGLKITPISERQLRERLKKILHFPGKPAAFIFQLFPELDRCCHNRFERFTYQATGFAGGYDTYREVYQKWHNFLSGLKYF